MWSILVVRKCFLLMNQLSNKFYGHFVTPRSWSVIGGTAPPRSSPREDTQLVPDGIVWGKCLGNVWEKCMRIFHGGSMGERFENFPDENLREFSGKCKRMSGNCGGFPREN